MVALSVSNAALMVCTRDLSRALASILRALDMFLLYLVVVVAVVDPLAVAAMVVDPVAVDAPVAAVISATVLRGNDATVADDGVAYLQAVAFSSSTAAVSTVEVAESTCGLVPRRPLVRSKGCGSGGGGNRGDCSPPPPRRCCVSVSILSTLRMSWNNRRPTSDDDSSLQLHGLNGVQVSMLIDRSTLAAAASAVLLNLAAVGHPSPPSSESSNRFRLNAPRLSWPSATADTSTPESSLWSVVGVCASRLIVTVSAPHDDDDVSSA